MRRRLSPAAPASDALPPYPVPSCPPLQECHKRGIEVILDVVFNHTAEGNEMGPTLSFRCAPLAEEVHLLRLGGCGWMPAWLVWLAGRKQQHTDGAGPHLPHVVCPSLPAR